MLDSRRLTGPNIFSDREGAVLDVVLGRDDDGAVGRWRDAVARLLDAVGWHDSPIETRVHAGGASLFIGAPIDSLYSGAELNELAWIVAEGGASGAARREEEARLRAAIAAEHDPALIALRDAATAHGVALVVDDDAVSLGIGAGSRTLERDALPAPSTLDWANVHDVPVALVTGSNGKTTTTRLVAAMVRAAGLTAGACDTDGVRVDDELVVAGDYSGPEGARLIVRDRRVETAVLETARGGILRRGLAVRRARAAIVTNVAADHFGEYGIHDLRSLAEAKLVVARAVDLSGRLVLNADDEVLCSLANTVRAPICWFALDAANETVRAHRARGGDACFVRDGSIVLARGALEEEIAPIAEVVMARQGTARHNIANALGGVALAAALGVPLAAIGDTLRSFGGSGSDNPGRMIELEIGDVHVVVDFAHNPHGIRALFEATAGIAAERRLLLIGQGGDRDDAALGELALTAWSHRPDAIVLKEMEKYLRGRPHGETTRVMEAALLAAGAPREAVSVEPTEMDGVRNMLRQARPGDLLLLTVHEDYEGVMGELQGLGPGAKGQRK